VVPEPPLRLFIAVPVPAAALEACRALVDGVRAGKAGHGARWVRTENLHLTLRFLGATPPERVADLARGVSTAASGRPAFPVALAGAGSFPSVRRPRALWLGIETGADRLAEIGRALDGPLSALGWEPEARPFRPHLTVARTDASSIADGAAAAAALVAAARAWRVTFTADRLVLYRSHLGRGAPRYEPVVETALDG
jgi:2'-5' RNA ligase